MQPVRKPAVVLLLTGLCFALIGISCLFCINEKEKKTSNKTEKLTIAVSDWPASLPIYIAQEKGFFRKQGLDISLQSCNSGNLGIEDVLAGRADLVTSTETPLARAIVESKPVAIVATMAEANKAMMVVARRDRGISNSLDLRGRRVGVVRGSSADFYLHVHLTTSYINPRSVRIVHLRAEEIVGALLKGRVDAVSAWPPYTMVLQKKLGSNAVTLHDPDIYTATWNLSGSRKFIQNNPERVKRVLRALLLANGYIRTDPISARTIFEKYAGKEGAPSPEDWLEYRFAAGLDESLVLNLEEQARWILGSREARRMPNFLDFVDLAPLLAVHPAGVEIAGHL